MTDTCPRPPITTVRELEAVFTALFPAAAICDRCEGYYVTLPDCTQPCAWCGGRVRPVKTRTRT